jgi:GNAT superfamily N-acetyltransferase
VRAALAVDADAIQEIFAANIGRADWLPPESRRCTDFSAVSIGETILVAVGADGKIAGFVSFHLHVRADARGKGAGTLLLESLRSCLPPPWRLKCVEENFAARAFYRGLGWDEIANGESGDGSYVLMQWQPGAGA